jgi:hypothetical protein
MAWIAAPFALALAPDLRIDALSPSLSQSNSRLVLAVSRCECEISTGLWLGSRRTVIYDSIGIQREGRTLPGDNSLACEVEVVGSDDGLRDLGI